MLALCQAHLFTAFICLFALLTSVQGAAPVLADIETNTLQISYYNTPNDASTLISKTITVTDADGDNIKSATVVITDFAEGDELTSTDTTVTAVSATYNAGTLTLTGAATTANYETVLRAVKYVRIATWKILDVPNYHTKKLSVFKSLT